jgi:hypothetical protein
VFDKRKATLDKNIFPFFALGLGHLRKKNWNAHVMKVNVIVIITEK